MPHGNIDPIVAAGAVITGLQVRVCVCVSEVMQNILKAFMIG